MGVRNRLARLLAEAPPDAPAIEAEGSWTTWGLIRSTARSLDEELNRRGLGRGSRIGVVLENSPEHVATLMALLATERCLVTLSPMQPAERLVSDIAHSGAPVVVASPEVFDRPGLREAVEADALAVQVDRTGAVEVLGGQVTEAAGDGRGVLIEMLTSGTTGPPKRVHLGEDQFDSALRTSVPPPKEDELFRSGVAVVCAPLVHIGGLWGAVGPLYSGRRVVLLPKFSLEPWLAAVEKHRPRAAGLVPAALRTVLDADVPRERLASLEVLTSGTTYCPPGLADEFMAKYGIRVLMTYGATEFAGAVAAWTLPMHQQWWETKAGSAGRAMPGVDLRVTDDEGRALPAGESGRLEIRTPQAPRGADRWVRTSDLARIDADGFLFVDGRADDAIMRGGFKVHPGQVAKVLERHGAVREAAVAPFPDERLGQVPVAAVELVADAPRPVATELVELCREVLMPYEVPVHVAVLEELPRTPSLKVSRVDLLELVGKELVVE